MIDNVEVYDYRQLIVESLSNGDIMGLFLDSNNFIYLSISELDYIAEYVNNKGKLDIAELTVVINDLIKHGN